MASIEELEAQAVKPGVDLEDDQDDDKGELLDDFWEATSLLAKSKTLLNFMADPVLCKGMSQRERDSMARLAEQLGGFLEQVEGVYDEEEF